MADLIGCWPLIQSAKLVPDCGHCVLCHVAMEQDWGSLGHWGWLESGDYYMQVCCAVEDAALRKERSGHREFEG